MKFKLIQTGGLTGKSKVAQIPVDELPKTTFNKLMEYFEDKRASRNFQSKKRDAYKYFWEINDNVKEIDVDTLPDELKHLFNKMKANLSYEK